MRAELDDQQYYNSNEMAETSFDLKAVLRKILSFWYVFLLSTICAVLISKLYIRYQKPVYTAKATVLIRDGKEGGTTSELSAFQDLSMLSGNSSLENEIEILKSRSLMMRVIKELNLQIEYVIKGKITDKEAYKNSPVEIVMLSPDSIRYLANATFEVKINSNSTYTLTEMRNKKKSTHKFNDTILSSIGNCVLSYNGGQNQPLTENTVLINIRPLSAMIDRYRGAVRIKPASKTSNVLEITMQGATQQKLVDVINNLLKQHYEDAIEDKNLISENTAQFINDRLKYITRELSEVEGRAQGYKQEHNIVDVETDAKIDLQSEKEAGERFAQINTQLKLADYMYQYIFRQQDYSTLIPANLGIADPATTSQIIAYNQFVLERGRLLKSSTAINPMIQNIDAQLDNIRQSLISSISNYRNSIQIQARDLSAQAGSSSSRVAALPRFQRQIRSIERQQQIKEQLYLYLLQKREETSIALAVTVGNSKTIDQAYCNGVPILPNKRNILLTSLALGLLLPGVILYVRDVLDSKVNSMKDIAKLNIPYLGEIPLNKSNAELVVSRGANTQIAESFRLLRSNLEFVMGRTKSVSQVIFVTSTIAEEGKSFVALNLASAYSLTDKKVLLMGLDLRMPKLLEYAKFEKKSGVSNYLIDDELHLDDIILKNMIGPNIDLLPSGDVPPNPAELLLMPGLEILFNELKSRYHCIIVDTAPVGIVTDTLAIANFADAFVYVIRAHYLEKSQLFAMEKFNKEKRLPNMGLLLNAVDHHKVRERKYGYGYGYVHEKPSRISRWLIATMKRNV